MAGFVPPVRLTRFRGGVDFNLPDGWEDSLASLAKSDGVFVSTDEASSTSVRERETIPLRYEVVTGDRIGMALPWLFELYNGAFLDLAQEVFGKEVTTSTDMISAVNLNVMRGRASTYEWHVDSNPVTALLFASTHRPGEGGQLEFDCVDHTMTIQPVAGDLLVFDARRSPHVVRSLTNENGLRMSVPMNYYFANEGDYRPEDLAEHLYGSDPKRNSGI